MMNRPVGPSPVATVSLLSTAFSSHDQSKALQRHVMQCAKARGRWFGVAMFAERIQHMILPRLATTVALGALTLGLFAHWL